jgi:motility quorum-sensing regulator/GCU-specific mRNA interferase toxin
MEKLKPHYLLSNVIALVSERGVDAFTATALNGAAALGLSGELAVSVVVKLKHKDFYKSMTTHVDHQIWQDVYHATLKSGVVVYIKLTLRANGTIVIQFKEK